jgi:predicted nuclease with RNAse H fold
VARSLGIDVGVRKGLDLVLLEDDRLSSSARRVPVGGLFAHLEAWRPDVVCIDSPPAFGNGGPRETEVALRRRGISLYATPWDPAKTGHAFYGWMHEGQKAFRVAARAGYGLFDRLHVRGSAMEVFPYACAVVLHGSLRPKAVPKEPWRREALRRAGIDDRTLAGIDQVDAALAAVVGLRALEGTFTAFGDPGEGVIVLPCREADLPARYLS